MLVIAKRIIKQIFHDKRSMAVMVIAPIMILTLIYFLLGDSDYKPTVALDKASAQTVMGSILASDFEKSLSENKDIVYSKLPIGTDYKKYVEDKKIDAVIVFNGQDIDILMLELVAGKMSIVTDALKTAADSAAPGIDMATEFLTQSSIPQIPGSASADVKPKIALESGTAPGALEHSLRARDDITYVELPSGSDVKAFIESGNSDAVLEFSSDGIKITLAKADPVLTPKITEAIRFAASETQIAQDIDVSLIFGSMDESTFDSLAYFLLSVLSFFMIFLFSGISFVRERTGGTLERLMRTPVGSGSVVAGYTLGFGFFAVIQSSLLILYAKFVINTLFVGQWWLAMLIMLLVAIVAVMMGMLVSVLSKTEFQVVQSIPLLIIPQIFFSGLIPVDMLPYKLNLISYILPLYYSGMGLKYVMVYGYGFEHVWVYIAVLLGMIVLLFTANVAAVKKSRRS